MKPASAPLSPSPLMRYLSKRLKERQSQDHPIPIGDLLKGEMEQQVRNRHRMPGAQTVATIALRFGETPIAVRQLFAAADYEHYAEQIDPPSDRASRHPRSAIVRTDDFDQIREYIQRARHSQIILVHGEPGNGKGDLVEWLAMSLYHDMPDSQRLATFTVSLRDLSLPERGQSAPSVHRDPIYAENERKLFEEYVAAELGMTRLAPDNMPLAIAQQIGRKRTLLAFRDVNERRAKLVRDFVDALYRHSFGNIVCLVCADTKAKRYFEMSAGYSREITPLTDEQAIKLLAPRTFMSLRDKTRRDVEVIADLKALISCLSKNARIPSSMYLLGGMAFDPEEKYFDLQDLRERLGIEATHDTVVRVAFESLGRAMEEDSYPYLCQQLLQDLAYFTGSFTKGAARAVAGISELGRVIGVSVALETLNRHFDELSTRRFLKVYDVQDVLESRRFILDRQSRDWIRHTLCQREQASSLHNVGGSDLGIHQAVQYIRTQHHDECRRRFVEYIVERLSTARAEYLANDPHTLDTLWRHVVASDLGQVCIAMNTWYEELRPPAKDAHPEPWASPSPFPLDVSAVAGSFAGSSAQEAGQKYRAEQVRNFVCFAAALSQACEACGLFVQGKTILHHAMELVDTFDDDDTIWSKREGRILLAELAICLAELSIRTNNLTDVGEQIDYARTLLPSISDSEPDTSDQSNVISRAVRGRSLALQSLLTPMLMLHRQRINLCMIILIAVAGSTEMPHEKLQESITGFSESIGARMGSAAATPEHRHLRWSTELWLAYTKGMHPLSPVDEAKILSENDLEQAAVFADEALQEAIDAASKAVHDAYRFRESRLIAISLLMMLRLMFLRSSLSQLATKHQRTGFKNLEEYSRIADFRTLGKVNRKGGFKIKSIDFSVLLMSNDARNEIKRALATADAFVSDISTFDMSLDANYRCLSSLTGRERLSPSLSEPAVIEDFDEVDDHGNQNAAAAVNASEDERSLPGDPRVEAETLKLVGALRSTGDTFYTAVYYVFFADQECRMGRLDVATDALLRALELWESLGAGQELSIPLPVRVLIGRTVEMLGVQKSDGLPEFEMSGVQRLSEARKMYSYINPQMSEASDPAATGIEVEKKRLSALKIPYDINAMRSKWMNRFRTNADGILV